MVFSSFQGPVFTKTAQIYSRFERPLDYALTSAKSKNVGSSNMLTIIAVLKRTVSKPK